MILLLREEIKNEQSTANNGQVPLSTCPSLLPKDESVTICFYERKDYLVSCNSFRQAAQISLSLNASTCLSLPQKTQQGEYF